MIAIIISLCIIATIAEFSTFITYGGFYKGPDLDFSIYELNPQDKSMMGYYGEKWPNYPFITTLPFGIFCKYYIHQRGQVPRWSKLHKKIKNKFNELRATSQS